MFNLFKWKSKRKPSKLIQMAYYLIYIQDDFRQRERYFHFNSMKLCYALFLIDMKHRAEHGKFLFEEETKTFGWHGFYYNSIMNEFGWLANLTLYKSYDGQKEYDKFRELSYEERKALEEFLEGHYWKLQNCMFSGDGTASFLSEETQAYLHAEQFPVVQNEILEELFNYFWDTTIGKEKGENVI
ncbi:hypothetical protein CVD28_02615 [Bacillus sp. M6-12]|uniref:hypothetical protein n=1 Tax=Bacillus sp. M6-12 TaxID=2054166 RepID=UPI000C78BFB5|nr:hypothetical protein [Bacillus sp. M6-12]PLS19325.1 hypothetical protein CVD28_02615 [Bacillus sp. M6-12]